MPGLFYKKLGVIVEYRGLMPLKRDTSTEESKEFWGFIDKTAREVYEDFPRHKLSKETRREWNMPIDEEEAMEFMTYKEKEPRLEVFDAISEELDNLDPRVSVADRNALIALISVQLGRLARSGPDYRDGLVKIATLAVEALVEDNFRGLCPKCGEYPNLGAGDATGAEYAHCVC